MSSLISTTTTDAYLETQTSLFYILIIVGSTNVILCALCIYYICSKLLSRTKQPGNASYWQTIKTFNVFCYVGIVLEICDMSTDYLFASSLIISENNYFNKLGWASLIFSVCGVSVFFFKYGSYRKLIAFQVKNLKEKAKSGDADILDIILQISFREMDIHIVSLFNGCVEDIPQMIIILIVNQNIEWNYISILTIALSMISFTLRLSTVVATKLGCCDESIPYYSQLPKEETNVHEIELNNGIDNIATDADHNSSNEPANDNKDKRIHVTRHEELCAGETINNKSHANQKQIVTKTNNNEDTYNDNHHIKPSLSSTRSQSNSIVSNDDELDEKKTIEKHSGFGLSNFMRDRSKSKSKSLSYEMYKHERNKTRVSKDGCKYMHLTSNPKSPTPPKFLRMPSKSIQHSNSTSSVCNSTEAENQMDTKEVKDQHKWQLHLNFDAKNKSIIINISDQITQKHYGTKLTQNDFNNNINKEYIKLARAVKNGRIKGEPVQNGNSLTVFIEGENNETYMRLMCVEETHIVTEATEHNECSELMNEDINSSNLTFANVSKMNKYYDNINIKGTEKYDLPLVSSTAAVKDCNVNGLLNFKYHDIILPK
eukprot:519059_1